MSELVSNGVHIYQFPTDDETVADINSTMNVRILAINFSSSTLLCFIGNSKNLFSFEIVFVLITITRNNFFPQGHLPFAVVGSMDEVKVGNKMVKARQYPWGTVQGTLT